MIEDPPAAPRGVDRSQWLRVRAVAIYAVFAALWILGSDRLLDLVFDDRATIVQAGTYKGWLFVAVTSGLLYWLMRRPVSAAAALPAAPSGSLRPWLLPFGGVVGLVVILAAAAISGSYRHYHDKEAGRLQAVADLRAGQIAQWLDERIAQARFASEGPLGGWFLRWHEGEQAMRERLAAYLASLRRASGSRAVLIVDDRGRMIDANGETGGTLAAELVPAVASAMRGDEVRFADPRGGGNDADSRFDIIAPMALGSGARAAIVLRFDPDDFLLPALKRWLLPDHSTTSMLIGRDRRALLNAVSAEIPPQTDVTKADAGSRAFNSRDAQGEPILSVVRPVGRTDWLLVTSIRSTEIQAQARRDAWWIAAVGAMAVFACAIGMFLLRERLALQLKGAEAREQAQRLHALQLLQSIADSSTDLIYARDNAGRFLLFNREAARASGVAAEVAIGKCGHDIFPAAQAAQMKATDQQVMQTGRPCSYESELDTVDGPRTFLSTKGLLRGPDGEPAGVFGISRDITERRRAEQALRDSAELVQAVEDSVLDHMAVLDADGIVIAVNAAWRGFCASGVVPLCRGLPRSGVGLRYLDALAVRDGVEAVAARAGIAAVLEGREPVFALEYRCACDQPHDRWFVMKVTPLKVARGGAVVVHSDITELKRSAAEIGRYRDHLEELVAQRTGELEQTNRTLAEGERFLRTLTDNLPASMGYWGRDLRCRFANRLCQERFGIGPEE
ncbi:MAG TPA: PAS domain-containing protein, partial [Ramlibacter sp.]|nr:PAS domain-containing protein [Ramlibacter sp.]